MKQHNSDDPLTCHEIGYGHSPPGDTRHFGLEAPQKPEVYLPSRAAARVDPLATLREE